MVGPIMRPQFVLFGSSIVEFSYGDHGWGAILADIYARKVRIYFFIFFIFPFLHFLILLILIS
jgi:hypothetical protein